MNSCFLALSCFWQMVKPRAHQPSTPPPCARAMFLFGVCCAGSPQLQSEDPDQEAEQNLGTVLSAAAAVEPSSDQCPLQQPTTASQPSHLAVVTSSSAGLGSAAVLDCSSPLGEQAAPAAVGNLLGRAQSAPATSAHAAVVPLTRSSCCALQDRAGRTAQCQAAATPAAHCACIVPDAAFCSGASTSSGSRSSSSLLSAVVAAVAPSPYGLNSSSAWQQASSAGMPAAGGAPLCIVAARVQDSTAPGTLATFSADPSSVAHEQQQQQPEAEGWCAFEGQLPVTASPRATQDVQEGSLPQHDSETECQGSDGVALTSKAAVGPDDDAVIVSVATGQSAAPAAATAGEGLCSMSHSHSSGAVPFLHSFGDAQQVIGSTDPQGTSAAEPGSYSEADPTQAAAAGGAEPPSCIAAGGHLTTTSPQAARPPAASCGGSSAVPLAAHRNASISPLHKRSLDASAAGFGTSQSAGAPAAGESAEWLDVAAHVAAPEGSWGHAAADSRSALLVVLTVLSDGCVLVGLMFGQAAQTATTAQQQTGNTALSCDATPAMSSAAAADAAQEAAPQAAPASCCGLLAADSTRSAAPQDTSRANSPVAASDLGATESPAEMPSLAGLLPDAVSSDHTEAAPAVVPAAVTLAVVPSDATPAAVEAVGEPCLSAAATPSGECVPQSAADGADTHAATPATETGVAAAAAAAGCAECQTSAVSADGLQELVDALSVASSSSVMGSPRLAAGGEHAAAALVVSPLQVEDSLQQQSSQGGSFADIGTPCLHAEGSMTTNSQLDSITVGYGGCSGSAPACFLLEPQVSARAACSVDAGTSRSRDAEQAASPTNTSPRCQQQLPASLSSLPLLEGSASWGPMCSPGAAPTSQRMYSPFASSAAQGETDELAGTAALQENNISTPPAVPGLSSQPGAGSGTLVAGSAALFEPGEGSL